MRLLLPLGLLLLPLLLGAAAAQPPTAVDDRFIYGSSQAVNGWFTVDVLANDSAAQARAVEVVSPPTDGVVESTTGPVGFRWKQGSAVSAQWTYRIVDAAGNYSNTATVSVGLRVGPRLRTTPTRRPMECCCGCPHPVCWATTGTPRGSISLQKVTPATGSPPAAGVL